MVREKKVYGKEMLCKGCGNDTFKLLLNVYGNTIPIVHPHFECVCDRCGIGFVIVPNSKEFEKHLRKLKESDK